MHLDACCEQPMRRNKLFAAPVVCCRDIKHSVIKKAPAMTQSCHPMALAVIFVLEQPAATAFFQKAGISDPHKLRFRHYQSAFGRSQPDPFDTCRAAAFDDVDKAEAA